MNESRQKIRCLSKELFNSKRLVFIRGDNSERTVARWDYPFDPFNSIINDNPALLFLGQGLLNQIRLGEIINQDSISSGNYIVVDCDEGKTKRIKLYDGDKYLTDIIVEYQETDFKTLGESIIQDLVDSISDNYTFRLFDTDRVVIGIDLDNYNYHSLDRLKQLCRSYITLSDLDKIKKYPNHTIGFVINSHDDVELWVMDSKSGIIIQYIADVEDDDLEERKTKLINHKIDYLNNLNKAEKNIYTAIQKGEN